MAAFTTVDYVVLAIFLAGMLGVGVWTGRRIRSTDEFFLADRKLKWPVLGLSFALFGTAALIYCSAPNEAYWQGMKFILVPIMVWATLPVALWCTIPLYHNLELDSVYEYLELRFDPRTRVYVGLTYLFWQLLWLGGLLVLPCRALQIGTGLNLPILLLVGGVGMVTLLYTFLGGMKASVWTGTAQFGVMAITLLVLIVALGHQFDTGHSRIRETANGLHRNVIFKDHPLVTSEFSTPGGWGAWTWWKQDATSSPEGVAPTTETPEEPGDDRKSDDTEQWVTLGQRPAETKSKPTSLWTYKWSVIPASLFLVLVSIYFVVADQATVQRWFSAEEDRDMRISYLMGLALFSVMAAGAMYVGMGLLAVYQDDDTYRDELQPSWVANSAVDPDTGEPFIRSDTEITAENAVRLAEQQKILDPNEGKPYYDPSELVDGNGKLVVDRLITRDTPWNRSERWIRRGHNELLSRFVTRHLKWGLAGLFLAALMGAAMAAVGSGITGLATLVVVDFHRRFGWAENWLGEHCEKNPKDLDQTDEMRLARPVVWGLGVAVVVVALVVGAIGWPLEFLIGVLGIFAGPMLAVFLLGLFTKRATGPAALIGMAVGIFVAAATTLWPFENPFGPFWPMPLGVVASLVVGYVFSFAVGRRKSKRELSGLVVAHGDLGVLLKLEEEPLRWEGKSISPPLPQSQPGIGAPPSQGEPGYVPPPPPPPGSEPPPLR